MEVEHSLHMNVIFLLLRILNKVPSLPKLNNGLGNKASKYP